MSFSGDHVHTDATRRNNYQYLFTEKHHGGRDRRAARWLPSLSEADEFRVFDEADWHEISDSGGNLFGALKEGAHSLRQLGTYGQQVAKFWCQTKGLPWHGFPVWPLDEEAVVSGQRDRPETSVFDKMVTAGIIDVAMRKRLRRGDFV